MFPGVFVEEGDGPGQVLTGSLGAGTVDEGEGVIPPLGQFQRMGEAVPRMRAEMGSP